MSDKLVNIKNLSDLAKKLDKRNNDNIAIISEKINEIEEFVNESINNIPEGFSGDYNDLENRPCYEIEFIENFVMEWDGNAEGLEEGTVGGDINYPDIPFSKYVRVGQLEIEYADLENYNKCLKEYGYTITFENGTTKTLNTTYRDGQLIELGDKEVMFVVGAYIHSPYSLMTSGIYFLTEREGLASKVVKIECTILQKELKQLDEKFISYKPGKIVAGETFTVNGVDKKASYGAEIFNNSANIATGIDSHAEGYNTKATGSYSHAEGYGSSASGNDSHAEGARSKASGSYSHAEGYETIASSDQTHAEGFCSTASGSTSHAEGCHTKATGSYSHAENYYAEASGDGSHAEGWKTKASGDGSHAEGYYTEAKGEYQHVQGKYNVEDTEEKYAHIVGNGEYNARSNAHTLDWDGNAWFAGKVTASVQPTDNNDLTTKEYVDNAIAQASIGGEIDTTEFATKNDLNGLASEQFVQNQIAAIEHPQYNDTELRNMIAGKADKSELFSGDYNDLENKPEIPTVTNDLTDELKANYDTAYERSISGMTKMYCIDGSSGSLLAAHAPSTDRDNVVFYSSKAYITSSGSIGTSGNINAKAFYEDGTALENKYVTDESLSAVAKSGSYNDLTNKPTASDIGAATEEYVNEKIAEIRDEMIILEEDDLSMEGLIDNTFPNLTTTDKTLIGAINELNNKLEKAPSGGDVPSEGIETEIEKAVIDEMLMDILGITVEEGE